MPAYFFRSEPGAAELRRLARRESGRVCQRILMIANHWWHVAGVHCVDPYSKWAISHRRGFRINPHRALGCVIRGMAAGTANKPHDGAVIQLNQSYTADPELGKLLATKDFRVALSLAINRDQITSA